MNQNNSNQDKSLMDDANNSCHDDEIDLVQIFVFLLKCKYLIAIVTFLFLVAGGVYIVVVPARFNYDTTVEIGSTLVNSGSGIVTKMIEPPEAALARLQESYIPMAVGEMVKGKPGASYKVKAKIPKESNLVILTSSGSVEMEKIYKELHTKAVEPLLEDHHNILSVPRRQYQISAEKQRIALKKLEDPRIFAVTEKDLQIQVDAEKMKLAALGDQKNLLLSQEKRLVEAQELLKQQIKTVEENLAQVYEKRPKAIDEVGNEAKAMTLLMISNQIEQNERRLSDLKERLTIGLEDQKEKLQNSILQNQREVELQKEKIAKLQSREAQLKVERESDQQDQKIEIASIENRLNDLRETRILGLAVRSVLPVGPGKKFVLAMSGGLGLFSGVLLAFLFGMMKKVRERRIF